jgi:hypothetical protein
VSSPAARVPRQHVRHEIRLAVELSTGGRLLACETDDASAGGCRIQTLFPLHRGDLVRIRLRAHGLPFEAGGSATVAWATREPPYRAGLQFSAPLSEQLTAFLVELLGPRFLSPGHEPARK